MLEKINFILKRRSIRKYTAEPVSDELVDLLLRAAMAAPSARNQQKWQFVVVREQAAKDEIAKIKPHGASMAPQASALIAVLGDPAGLYMETDTAAAVENILIAAANLDLGAVWVGMNDTHQEKMRVLLEFPESLRIYALVPVGYPDEEKPVRTQYDGRKVHKERFRG